MCGITGIVTSGKTDPREERLEEALRRIAHRGPDRQSTLRDKGAALGHARLSIIAPGEEGDQPMKDHSGRYAIVFNGELYNYRELREELISEGIPFRSDSDTEVFLQWFIARGAAGLQRVDGFYAFAVWDREEESIVIGRDLFGIKPLFYREEEEAFLFGSELSAILAFDVPLELDRRALALYFRLTYVPAPHSMVEGVRKLLPGEWMKIGPEGRESGFVEQEEEKRWEGSFREATEACRDLLESSVKARMRSDVPFGTFLSGGIDSGIITALASKHSKGLPSFSIGYEEAAFDESQEARETADLLGTRHHSFQVGSEAFSEGLGTLLEHLDEPFADSSAIPFHLLSKWSRKHVKMVLSGDGADELWGGYNKHRAEYMARHKGWKETLAIQGAPIWHLLPKGRGGGWKEKLRRLDRFARVASLPPEERYREWASFNPSDRVDELLKKVPVSEQRGWMKELFDGSRFDGMEELLQVDRAFVLPNDMLMKVDRASMLSGLEVRVPFLDRRFVRFVESLPSEWRIDRKERKRLLKRTFSDLLPSGAAERPKRGFEVPLASLLRKSHHKEVKRLCDPAFIREQAIFDEKAVERAVREWEGGKSSDNGILVYTLYIFQKWWERYFL